MQKLLLPALILLTVCNLHAQFSTDKLQIRMGYNLHNTGATAVNHLIEAFNSTRYPVEISENLPSINWPTGIVFGANYLFREDMIFYATFKNRRQFIEAPYVQHDSVRQYLFRTRTLELGMMVPLRDDDFFSHFVGGGLMFGVMGGHTAWTKNRGYHGARDMVSIDNTSLIGLSLCYEAQLRLHRNVRIFLRPVAQFATRSPMRRLTDFFDPQVQPNGSVTYGQGEPDKYDRAGFNGIGIEGGLLVLLPEF
jgi:hypothetical protein